MQILMRYFVEVCSYTYIYIYFFFFWGGVSVLMTYIGSDLNLQEVGGDPQQKVEQK